MNKDTAAKDWYEAHKERVAAWRGSRKNNGNVRTTIAVDDLAVLVAATRHALMASYNLGIDPKELDGVIADALQQLEPKALHWLEQAEARWDAYLANFREQR